MNNENNSQIDSLNNLNNESITPTPPTPVVGENTEDSAIAETNSPIEPVADNPSTPVDNPVENPIADATSSSDIVELTPGKNEEKVEEEIPSADGNTSVDVTTSNPSPGLPTATAVSSNTSSTIPETPAPVSENDKTAVGFDEKKGKGAGLKVPLIIITVLVVLGALGYFVVYPMIKNKFMVTPKNVFESTITRLKTQINNSISSANIANTITDVSIKVDTNMEGMDEFKDYTYGFRFGIDNKAKSIEGKVYMLDKNSKEYSILGYVKGEDIIAKLSHDERLVKVAKTTDIEGFDDIFDMAKNVNPDDYSYLTNKVVDSIFSTFKDEDFTKDDATIKVNGTEVKVKKNSYILNRDRVKNIYNTVVNDLYNDSRSMEIINSWGMTKEEFKKELIDETDFDDFKDEDAVTVNIYIDSNNQFVGFDIVNNDGDKPVYYYSNEGSFNLFFGDDTGDNPSYVNIDGVKNGDAVDVTIKSNGKDTIATLKVYTWTEEEIKFDFNINSDVAGSDQPISGTIEYKNTKSSDANNINIKATYKSGSDQLSITLNLKQELNAKIADIDASKAVTLSDEVLQKWSEGFVSSLEGTPFGYLLSSGMNNTYNTEEQNEPYEDYSSQQEFDYGF